MGNAAQNTSVILNEALEMLTSKPNFINNINRQYDKSYKDYGDAGRPGTQLNLRLPQQYTTRTGLPAQVQGQNEQTVALVTGSVLGIDMDWNSVEEVMDNWPQHREQQLEPAMAQLGASLEAAVFSVYKDVYQEIGTPGTMPGDTGVDAWTTYNGARAGLNKALAPFDKRAITLNSDFNNYITSSLKTLYHDDKELSKQYMKGKMGSGLGFDGWFENELTPVHTPGLMAGTPVVAGGSQLGSSLNTSGWTAGTTITQGTIFTFSTGTAVQMVHPQTRVTYGKDQQFVVTADAVADTNGLCTLAISPSIIISGAYQTVTNSPTAGATLTFRGTASTPYSLALAFQKDFATLVTADLKTHKECSISMVKQFEGISLRYEEGYDIQNSRMIRRFDILYGFKTIRPQLCYRIAGK